MKNVMVALLMASGLLLWGAGCSKGGGDKTGAAAASESVGVAECDEYIKKYEGCLGKLGGPAKLEAEMALKIQREGFKRGASTPEGKATLKTSCQSILDKLPSNPICK